MIQNVEEFSESHNQWHERAKRRIRRRHLAGLGGTFVHVDDVSGKVDDSVRRREQNKRRRYDHQHPRGLYVFDLNFFVAQLFVRHFLFVEAEFSRGELVFRAVQPHNQQCIKQTDYDERQQYDDDRVNKGQINVHRTVLGFDVAVFFEKNRLKLIVVEFFHVFARDHIVFELSVGFD